MLQTLTLKNFRQHEDRTFQFTEGLNVIRGANEAGKTTILEAMNYAMFGAVALRDPVDEVVTYGRSRTTLAVELQLLFNNVSYNISRTANGAEISVSDSRTITGQSATRNFMEHLLGADWAVISNLQFADQYSIRGILASGPTAAGGLVEKLANLDAIDGLINRVQSSLPYGSTGILEDRIQRNTRACEQSPEQPSKQELDNISAKISEVAAKIDLSDRARIADQNVAKGVAAIEAKKRSEADLARFEARVLQLQALYDRPIPNCAITQADIDKAIAHNAGLDEHLRREKAYRVKGQTAEHKFGMNVSTFIEHCIAASKQHRANIAAVTELEKKVAVLEALFITEKTCGLCGKDLTAVPEVVEKNSKTRERIREARSDLAMREKSRDEWAEYLMKLEQAKAIQDHNIRVFNLDYWEIVDENVIPHTFRWKGELPGPFAAVNVKPLQQELDNYKRLITERETYRAERAKLVKPEVPDVQWAEELLAKHEVWQTAHNDLLKQMQGLKAASMELQHEYDSKLQIYFFQCDQLEKAKAQLAEDQETLKQMYRNNGLLQRLRSARPQVASQLWSLVLGTVSQYFSSIRDTNSIVTRDAEGFKVDGRSVRGGGLSGSALDALGLAIRLSLSKVFLPNVPWMCLDESFSAADANRELAGLGTLASCGFEQVILVTHSSMPETIADNLITI